MYVKGAKMGEIDTLTAKRLIAGDEEAAKEIYEGYRTLLYFIIVSITKNQEDAEDVFQNVFLKLFSHRDSIVDPKKLRSYMSILARNEALRFVKERDGNPLYSDIMDIYGSSDKDNDFIQDIMAPLTDIEGIVVSYHLLYDYSFREMETLTGISRSEEARIYKEAIKKLKKANKR